MNKEFHKSDFKILRKDDEQRKVWGIFSMTKINGKTLVDLHGDVISSETLQKAAHDFVLYSRVGGQGHTEMGVGKLIESIVITEEVAKAMVDALKSVGVENPVIEPNADFWFGGFYIDKDETWELVKSGEFDAFSIGGIAQHTAIELED
jgi:hypothetical protein